MCKKITKTLIEGESRICFLPSLLPKHHFYFEQLVYSFMDRFCDEYCGGFWHFYSLDNGGFFIQVDSDQVFHVHNPDNYFNNKMTSDSVSIGVNLYALNFLANTMHGEDIIDFYDALLDFACEHVESAKILRFID